MVVLTPRQLDIATGAIELEIHMNSTHDYLIDSLKDDPIGETMHFVWFITDIGIAALFKGNEILKTYSLNVGKEAKDISLDISKEEKEYFEIEDKKLFIFYS